MTTSALKQRGPSHPLDRVEPPGPPASTAGAAPAPPAEEDPASHSGLPGPHAVPPEVPEALAAGTPAEPDEALVADPRGRLTPSQMVDRSLLAKLGGGHPGLFRQAKGGPGAPRGLPGQ